LSFSLSTTNDKTFLGNVTEAQRLGLR